MSRAFPMSASRRVENYRAQNPGRNPTRRQLRQVARMLLREELRAEGTLAWGPPRG